MIKGQHFLADSGILERIASYAELGPDDRILEIGPGPGNLTKVLAEHAGTVYAVEVDPLLAAGLTGKFPNVTVTNADALTVELPDYNKVVSNLPYQISSKITYRLLSRPRPFELAVLMFQREFARRMLAAPGSEEYGRLAMVVGFFCQAKMLESIPRTAFRPMPEVNSAIVRLRPRLERPAVEPGVFMRLAEGLFRSRRKKVKKALAAMGAGREALAELNKCQPALLDRRPEELTPDEAAKLARALYG
ncbi:putative ribosomal RNA small subunit methyltransferase A [uncultured archaeon]|nr:putative ribosomal RNA small subunit methyltransferase A [uncultured archaeon]